MNVNEPAQTSFIRVLAFDDDDDHKRTATIATVFPLLFLSFLTLHRFGSVMHFVYMYAPGLCTCWQEIFTHCTVREPEHRNAPQNSWKLNRCLSQGRMVQLVG